MPEFDSTRETDQILHELLDRAERQEQILRFEGNRNGLPVLVIVVVGAQVGIVQKWMAPGGVGLTLTPEGELAGPGDDEEVL